MTVSYILCCKKTHQIQQHKNIHKRVNAILFHLYKILKLEKLLYELKIRAVASLSRVTGVDWEEIWEYLLKGHKYFRLNRGMSFMDLSISQNYTFKISTF